MTRPRRALAAACAAAATAGGHLADTDAADRCTLPGARVIRQDSRARLLLVRVKGDNPRRYYGCLRNQAPRLLAQEYNPHDVDAGEFHGDFRLAGVTVAWNEFDYDGSGFGSRSFTLHLRTLGGGRGTDVTTYDDDSGPLYGYPGQLALGAGGALAWTLEPDSDNENSDGATEILGIPAGSTRVVALGAEFDIVEKSLRVVNGRATWREKDGTRHTVAIAPPPPPLLPAPSGHTVGPQGIDPRFGSCSFEDLAPKLTQISDGTLAPTPDGGLVAGVGTYSDTVAVSRLTADGALDTGFGSGGTVTTKLPKQGKEEPDQTHVFDLIGEPDGSVVAGGTGGLAKPGDSDVTFRPLLVRYDAAGRLDPAFGRGGFVHGTLVGKGDVSVTNLALAPDGGLLATVSSSKGGNVLRIRPDGTPDPAFGGGGRIRVPVVAALDVSQDGGMTLAGAIGDRIELDRYGPTGARLSSSRAGLPGSGSVAGLARLAGGGWLVAGSVGSTFVSKARLVLVRFTADGRLDTTFGRSGVLDDPSVGPASDVRPEADGGWLVAAKNGLARYTADGTRDPGFGRGGLLIAAPLGAFAAGPDGTVLAMDPDLLAVERFALADPALSATAAAAPVCDYPGVSRTLHSDETTRRVRVDANFLRPGTYTGTAALQIGARTFPLGRHPVFISGVNGFAVPWNVGSAGRRALARARHATVTVTIGVPGGPSTTDTLVLKD